jgi:pimeloyl-ACP methyl ester carboxylesterase
MPSAYIRGVDIVYRMIGSEGPWLALMPGGRRGHNELVSLAEAIAAAGFRVLLHDRRNTGASEIRIEGTDSEEAIWADDLAELLLRIDTSQAFIGGLSSGSRMAMLFALRHPAMVRGLVLCRVTGGPTAARRLPENYYGQFIKAAQSGGMAAVLETPQYQERIAANPANRERLLALDPAEYIAAMSRWRDQFTAGTLHPVLGISPTELASIKAPTIVIPGNDLTHSYGSGVAAQRGIPGAELCPLSLVDTDREIIPFEEWKPHEQNLTRIFVNFMRRVDGDKRPILSRSQ